MANDYLNFGPAQDGQDGTGITPPAGGAGIRGWLSGIYGKATPGSLAPLASAVTVTGAGTGVALTGRTFTVIVSGTTASGTGAATILIQGSHDNTKWATLGTSNLSLSTTIAVDALGSFVPYGYVRINVTAISGTGAAISATVEA